MSDRWQKSHKLLRRARKSLAGGVSSPFRAKSPVPLYFADSSGSRVRDVDDNEYIDYGLAWGPLILGHRHPKLVEALCGQVTRPHIYGAQHELEYLVAEKIQEIVPCAERVTFTSSGSEAVQLALRLARAYTGRNLVLKFEGHYHGWMDSVLLGYRPTSDEFEEEGNAPVPESAGQVSNAAENLVVARWNCIETVERILREREIAAVIMEPVLCNGGCRRPEPGYLEAVKEIARRHGALLIFDEVITGFRMALGGAQAFYGVVPDLATLGKAVAGGLPLSCIVGRKEIMELMMNGGVAFGGTFNGNPLSLAAAQVTLDELSLENGRPIETANETGKTLMEKIGDLAASHGIRVTLTGFGCAFSLHFTTKTELRDYRDTLNDDRERLSKYLSLALSEGIYLLPDGRMYVSIVHTERDVAETVDALDRVFEQIA